MIHEELRRRWRGALELAMSSSEAAGEIAAGSPEGGHQPHCIAWELGSGREVARARWWQRPCQCWASEPRLLARMMHEHADTSAVLHAATAAVNGHAGELRGGAGRWEEAVVAAGLAHAGVVAALERQVQWGSGWWSAARGVHRRLELEEGEVERCAAAARAASTLAGLWEIAPGPVLAAGLVELASIREEEPELIRSLRRLPGPAGCIVLLDSGLQAVRGAGQEPGMEQWWAERAELAMSPRRWAYIPGSGLGQHRWRSVLAAYPHQGRLPQWDAPGWIVEVPAELVRAVNAGPWAPWASVAEIPRLPAAIELGEVARIACELVGDDELELAVTAAVDALA